MAYFILILVLVATSPYWENKIPEDWLEGPNGEILNPYHPDYDPAVEGGLEAFLLREKRAKKNKIRIIGRKVHTTTPLSPEGMRIQEEEGCIACHKK